MTLDELLQGRSAAPRVRPREGRRARFLHDKEFYLAARSLKDKVGMQVVTPLAHRRRRDRAVRPRLDSVGAEGSGQARRGPAAGHGRARPASCGAARCKRQFAPDNDPAQNVWFHVDVPLMRSMAGGKPDPGARHASSSRPTPTPNPGRRADRRPDPARHPQRPSAVRHHLVPDRAGAGRRLSRLSLGERPAHRRRPHEGQDA